MSKIDRNSTRNQDIKREFVQREVLACISDWADQLFGCDFDDWDNVYGPVCPNCGRMNTVDIDPDAEEYDPEDTADTDAQTLPYCCSHCDFRMAEIPDEDIAGIYEYWIVSPWLGEKLLNHGEAIMERYHGWVWGRGTTGQAILLDGVISDICEDLGLLKDGDDV